VWLENEKKKTKQKTMTAVNETTNTHNPIKNSIYADTQSDFNNNQFSAFGEENHSKVIQLTS